MQMRYLHETSMRYESRRGHSSAAHTAQGSAEEDTWGACSAQTQPGHGPSLAPRGEARALIRPPGCTKGTNHKERGQTSGDLKFYIFY